MLKEQARPGTIRGVPAAVDAVRAYEELTPERRAALDAFIDAARPIIEGYGASVSIGWRVDVELPDWVAFVVEAVRPGEPEGRAGIWDALGEVFDRQREATADRPELGAWLLETVSFAAVDPSRVR